MLQVQSKLDVFYSYRRSLFTNQDAELSTKSFKLDLIMEIILFIHFKHSGKLA